MILTSVDDLCAGTDTFTKLFSKIHEKNFEGNNSPQESVSSYKYGGYTCEGASPRE